MPPKKIERRFINNEDKSRKLTWISRIFLPAQRIMIIVFLRHRVEGNFYNALLLGKVIGIYQVKAKVEECVPVAHAQVRTIWQRCGVTMRTYDFIDKGLKKQGHRLIENPDQSFVRPASRKLWAKRRELGKC